MEAIEQVGVILMGSALALALAAWCAVRILRTRKMPVSAARGPDAAEELRSALEAHRAACQVQLAELSGRVEALADILPGADQILREGRLNLSARAQAIQMMRSGISADAAAVTLGLPRQDMRLLARVSQALRPDNALPALKNIGGITDLFPGDV